MSLSNDKSAAASADAMLGPNPFLGFGPSDILRETLRIARMAAAKPSATAQRLSSLLAELSLVMRDESKIKPKPRDKRFGDQSWQSDSRFKKWLQSYLVLEQTCQQWLQEQQLEPHDRARIEFILSMVLDALAPTNFPWQPEAIRRFRQSRGHSAVEGIRHLAEAMLRNGGLPEQVDKSAFDVGQNVANTEGSVILREELFELIRYRPKATAVRQVPILITPPQINKYYIFDLSPEKSVVKSLLEAGFDVFVISWRNPLAEHAGWGMAEYTAAIDKAVSATCSITQSEKINVVGACAGGLTLAAYTAVRAAAGDKRVSTMTLVVNVLDIASLGETPLGIFATPRAIESARKKSRKKGVLEGRTMASAFSWLRPNDLIWNNWVNNVLLGNKPPAFDLLYWSNDSTRLAAGLHSEFLDIFQHNRIAQPDKLRLHGVPVNLGRIEADSFILGGTTDHITPWKACYRSTQLLGGNKTFVLSNAGHMQSLLNPPTNKKAEFWSGGELVPDAEEWRQSAEHHLGSWWPFWHQWLHERSGDLRPSPAELGDCDFPVLEPAPGSYVRE